MQKYGVNIQTNIDRLDQQAGDHEFINMWITHISVVSVLLAGLARSHICMKYSKTKDWKVGMIKLYSLQRSMTVLIIMPWVMA